MTLRRHKIIVSDNCWHQAVVRPDGQWVRYSDAEREIASLRAQLAAAEADKFAAMERVREVAASRCDFEAKHAEEYDWPDGADQAAILASVIRAIKLDALAEGEK